MLAAALLMGSTAPVGILAGAAPAQAQNGERAIAFDIPAQPLGQALAVFSQQAGVDVVYGGAVPDVRSPSVSGTLSTAEALSQLLTGSGLTYRQIDPHRFTLEPAPTARGGAIQLGPVRVEGESGHSGGFAGDYTRAPSPGGFVASRSAAAAKTDTPLLETPQAVSVVTRQQMEAQGINTVAEALRYTPGVLTETNGYDIRYDWLYVRGFNAYGTVWLDGLALVGDPSGYAVPRINPYALERVEVLKGPSSGLYGRTLPGGLINHVSKRPQASAHHEIEIGTSSFGGVQASVDLTGPLTSDGTLQYRLVGQGRDMETQVDQERDRQIMVAPSLKWAPDERTSLTVYGYYQRDIPKNFNPRFFPAMGTLLPNANGQIPSDLYVGNPGANEFERDFYSLGYELSHRIGENWTLRQNARYSHAKQDMFFVLVNPAFAYRPDGRTLNRVSAGSEDELNNFNVDSHIEGRFLTGAIEHTLLVGLDYLSGRSDRKFGNSPAGVPPLNYLNPDYSPAVIPYPAYSVSVLQKQQQVGVYVQDQARYGSWLGTFTLRWDHSEIRSTNRLQAGAPIVNTTDEKVTGRVGLSYLFDNGIAPYVSYSTAFLPTLGTTPSGGAYEPQIGEQLEAGVKYEPEDGRGLVTVSIYDLRLKNALTPTFVSGTQVGFEQTGKQRVRGIELEAKYELTPELAVLASYAYSDSKITRSNRPVELGREVLRLPEHQGSVWINFQPGFAPGLSLNGGVRATSSYQTDSTYLPELRIPSRALIDIGAGYDMGTLANGLAGSRLRVNVANLLDKRYVSHCLNATGGSCNYGARRAVTASLAYSF